MSKVYTILAGLALAGAVANAATTVTVKPRPTVKQTAKPIEGKTDAAIKAMGTNGKNAVAAAKAKQASCSLANAQDISGFIGNGISAARVQDAISKFSINDGQCIASGEKLDLEQVAQLVKIAMRAIELEGTYIKGEDGQNLERNLKNYFLVAYKEIMTGKSFADAQTAYAAFTTRCNLMKAI